MSRLATHVALVTGGASGIGRATALRLAREGARVALADIDAPELQETARILASHGGQVIPLTFDVTSESAWATALQTLQERWARLDILVNAAGISMAKPIVDTRLEDWRRVHSVNLDGVFLGTRTALRAMQASGGVLINIASLAGLDVYPGAAAYASSKAAVIHFSKVAAQEAAAAPSGIRVHVIAPGGVKTPMWHSLPNWSALAARGEAAAWQALDPAGEFLTAEEMAEVVLSVILDTATPGPGEVVIPRRAADGTVQIRA